MSDKKEEKKDTKKEEPPKPLENVKVEVDAGSKTARNPDERQATKKIEDSLTKNIKKVIDDNKAGGVSKQLDAAKKEVKKAGESADPRHIKEIDATGTDTDGEDDREDHRSIVTSNEKKKKKK